MKSSGIGGQAVLEGVMMKNGKEYAVAVRKPDGEIEIKKDTYEGITSKNKLFRVPFVRGMFNFIESMSLGMDIINYSASFYEEEGEQESFIINTSTEKYHKHNCRYVGDTANFEEYTGLRTALEDAGYEACKVCNP